MKRQQAHHITVSFKNENLCRIFERERNRIKTSFVTSRFIACRYLFVWPISLANGTGISFDTFHLFQSFGFFLAQLNYYYVAHTFWHNACLVGRSVGHNFFFFFGESDRCDKPKHAYSGQNCEKKTQNIGIGYSAATIGIGGKKDPEIMNSQARTKYTTHTHMFVFIYQLLLSLLSTSALVAFGRTANNVNMNGKW